MTLIDCVNFLVSHDYMVKHKGKFLFTTKFYQEMTGASIGVVIPEVSHVEIEERVVKRKKTVTVRNGEKVSELSVNWVLLYQQFIMEAGVPKYGVMDNGGKYELNHATKPGREAFRKALLEGAEYDKLVTVAKAYYSTRSYRKKIENFFVEELWRNDYGIENPDKLNDGTDVIDTITFG